MFALLMMIAIPMASAMMVLVVVTLKVLFPGEEDVHFYVFSTN